MSAGASAPPSSRTRAGTAEEDVIRFGEELQRLDYEVESGALDEAARQDWQRALDAYDSANRSLQLLKSPDEVEHVTSALEDGRYAITCVLARAGRAPPPGASPTLLLQPLPRTVHRGRGVGASRRQAPAGPGVRG